MNRHRTALAATLPVLLALSCGSDNNAPTPPPPDKADLEVSSILFVPESPLPQDEATARVTVWNAGRAPSGASVTRVEVDGSVTCGAVPVGALSPGQAVTVSCNLGFQPTGPREVRACADAGSALDEGSEQNNCATATLIVEEPPVPGPDLLVEAIEFVPPDPDPNVETLARVTVRNVGNQASAASSLRLELNGVVQCPAVATPIIQAGETATVSCDLGGNLCGKWPVRACADREGVIAETNEQNNCTIDTLRVGEDPCPPPEPWNPPPIRR